MSYMIILQGLICLHAVTTICKRLV